MSSSPKGTTIQNDAELKILETTLRTPALQALEYLKLDIFTDRASCAYCQEVSFRANHVFDDYQILGKIRPLDTNIAGVTMRGKPLFSGERIPIKDSNNMVENAIDFIEQVKRDEA